MAPHPQLTVVEASEVTAEFAALAKTWDIWDSSTEELDANGKFRSVEAGEHDTERTLIISGYATLTPDDGSPDIIIKEGQMVWFHDGFGCSWDCKEPIRKYYELFDKNGVILKKD